MKEILDWLKHHWFLLTALIAIGTAWGQTTTKVAELEKRLDEKTKKEQKIDDLADKTSRLDERTIIIQKEIQDQKAILNQILQNQTRMIRQVNGGR